MNQAHSWLVHRTGSSCQPEHESMIETADGMKEKFLENVPAGVAFFISTVQVLLDHFCKLGPVFSCYRSLYHTFHFKAVDFLSMLGSNAGSMTILMTFNCFTPFQQP